MGIYSFYLGLIYNEFFSMPTYIFGRTRFRCYDAGGSEIIDPSTGASLTGSIDPRDCKLVYRGVLKMPPDSAPVVFGIDPIWHGRKTELPYLNSVKMKMSILIGVTHMNFGILNSLFNNLYWKDTLSTLCEFVPQMIFFNFIFGYLCLLIVIKWCTGQLTDLYHVMIYMFLSPGGGFDDPAQLLVPGQPGLQVGRGAAAQPCNVRPAEVAVACVRPPVFGRWRNVRLHGMVSSSWPPARAFTAHCPPPRPASPAGLPAAGGLCGRALHAAAQAAHPQEAPRGAHGRQGPQQRRDVAKLQLARDGGAPAAPPRGRARARRRRRARRRPWRRPRGRPRAWRV